MLGVVTCCCDVMGFDALSVLGGKSIFKQAKHLLRRNMRCLSTSPGKLRYTSL